MLTISHIDHIVLTVKDIPVTLEFYARVLGMYAVQYAEDRVALTFSNQKINLHQAGKELKPNAEKAAAGSADLCLITKLDLEQAMQYVRDCDVAIIEGPVKRIGAQGKLMSFYIRDPDLNLIEISNQV